MTSSIGGTLATTPSQASTATHNWLEIPSEQFLAILIAQSVHQNPLEPQRSGDSVLQLAALAELSALQEINGTLKQFLATRNADVHVTSWIGRTALIVSDTAFPLVGGGFAGQLLNGSAGDVDATFQSADGRVLCIIRLPGPVTPGQEFRWDGFVDGLPYRDVVKVSVNAGDQPLDFGVWMPVAGVTLAGQSGAFIETPSGRYAPEAVVKVR